MTGGAVEVHRDPSNTLASQIEYARTVQSASMVPQAYRGKPADILIAVQLGDAMGLSPIESLYRIDVIQGKPTASAELIASNIRKAGHRLRVTGDERSCTATVVRSDDPDFEFTVTRDDAWAKAMGLANKENYKKQPGTMLQWRAITAVGRLACPEALYGVAYTSDEMVDVRPARRSGGLGAALREPAPAEQGSGSVPEGGAPGGATPTSGGVDGPGPVDLGDAPEAPTYDEPEPDVVDADVVEDHPAEPPPARRTAPAEPKPASQAQLRMIHARMKDFDLDGDEKRDRRLWVFGLVVGREVESSNDLTADDASTLLDTLSVAGDADGLREVVERIQADQS